MLIKPIRQAKGMTQEELARAMGVKRTAVAMWETGASAPRVSMIPKLAAVLECTVDDLFRGEDEKTEGVG